MFTWLGDVTLYALGRTKRSSIVTGLTLLKEKSNGWRPLFPHLEGGKKKSVIINPPLDFVMNKIHWPLHNSWSTGRHVSSTTRSRTICCLWADHRWKLHSVSFSPGFMLAGWRTVLSWDWKACATSDVLTPCKCFSKLSIAASHIQLRHWNNPWRFTPERRWSQLI